MDLIDVQMILSISLMGMLVSYLLADKKAKDMKEAKRRSRKLP